MHSMLNIHDSIKLPRTRRLHMVWADKHMQRVMHSMHHVFQPVNLPRPKRVQLGGIMRG